MASENITLEQGVIDQLENYTENYEGGFSALFYGYEGSTGLNLEFDGFTVTTVETPEVINESWIYDRAMVVTIETKEGLTLYVRKDFSYNSYAGYIFDGPASFVRPKVVSRVVFE